MRPLRFLLSLATCIAAFFILLLIGPWRASAEEDLEERSSIGAYFNWRTPSSLFPPSAIVSLTDDNSTFFLARPAAFGPLLPSKSLSGQLWVGSGFGDDHLGRGGPGAGAEGELGCSDIPDWNDGKYRSNSGSKKVLDNTRASAADAQDVKNGKSKRSMPEETYEQETEDADEAGEDDGTDDHLHHPLSASDGLKTNGEPAGKTKKPAHADIQSLQEGAEIAGKIVLLSRGGCGFLEKVKWVQRRGGVALIVGDDIRGGPLVTMYARGDTLNVTIPSLFTSHTTAHLLSSLIPSGGILDDLSAEEIARLGLALGDKVESGKEKDKHEAVEKPNFTTTSVATKATSTSKSQHKEDAHPAHAVSADDQSEQDEVGWFKSLFSSRSNGGRSADSRRPPSSGHIGWVLQEDFEEEASDNKGMIGKQATSTSVVPTATKTADGDLGDGFVIGVQDWRDPDLVAEQKERQQASTSLAPIASPPSMPTKHAGLKGGSITPGSGEYAKAAHEAVDLISSNKQSAKVAKHSKSDHTHQQKSGNWLTRLFHSSTEQPKSEAKPKKADAKASEPVSHSPQTQDFRHNHQLIHDPPHHEGLWVTLTPTSMSSSPFFDTLLVLVVSPLVTLTVVYALLLLRSRIRRRRWRAPKSVVERLPVRTYQTMPSTATTSSTTSSASTPISASTPLLPTDPRPINARSRPRSRTASEVPVQPSSSLRSDAMAPPSLEQTEEKRSAGLAEWRRRYGGKQRECVVCLEEYVDGVSRVMSLPCGHEFHAECITPWLTTRRRTCPICKGDVVRSLARSAISAAMSSPPQQHYHDEEDEEEVQEQAAITRNDDPAAAQPVSREDEAFEDLERGVGVDRTR